MVNTSWLKARKQKINKEEVQRALKNIAERQLELKNKEREKFLLTN